MKLVGILLKLKAEVNGGMMTNLADEDAQRTIHSTVLNPHAGDKLLRKK